MRLGLIWLWKKQPILIFLVPSNQRKSCSQCKTTILIELLSGIQGWAMSRLTNFTDLILFIRKDTFIKYRKKLKTTTISYQQTQVYQTLTKPSRVWSLLSGEYTKCLFSMHFQLRTSCISRKSKTSWKQECRLSRKDWTNYWQMKKTIEKSFTPKFLSWRNSCKMKRIITNKQLQSCLTCRPKRTKKNIPRRQRLKCESNSKIE